MGASLSAEQQILGTFGPRTSITKYAHSDPYIHTFLLTSLVTKLCDHIGRK